MTRTEYQDMSAGYQPPQRNAEQTDPRAEPAGKAPLPAHLESYWGKLTIDPRDKAAFCYRQSVKTPAIPWHNGATVCLSCGKGVTR